MLFNFRISLKFLTVLTILYALMSFVLYAQQDEKLPLNTVIEKVICRTDTSQSYALFLPPKYSPDKKWPIIYALDPGARGEVPVKLFQEAASLYGYIVVGSNNSQNGPWEPIIRAIKAIWEDTHSRFSIDEKRIYSAGFSGRGRAAAPARLA
jgi:predicted peptidase